MAMQAQISNRPTTEEGIRLLTRDAKLAGIRSPLAACRTGSDPEPTYARRLRRQRSHTASTNKRP